MSDAIRLSGVSKKFKIFDRPLDRLREYFSIRGRKYHSDFWALQDIELTVKKGEAIGIIGANGSGKSTLLQVIAGILQPTRGHVYHSGRMTSLLELGSGFNMEMTGRENIYINAAILGLNYRDIRRLEAEIIDFADIGEFIDHPVKTYSSGMFLRLAFSIAIADDPSIILIDEFLAVGDIGFRDKCFNAIRKLIKKSTVVMVTHDTNVLKTIAPNTILLNNGRIDYVGPTDIATDKYVFEMQTKALNASPQQGPQELHRTEHIDSVSILVCGEGGAPQSEFKWGEMFMCRTEFTFRSEVQNLTVVYIIRTKEGIEVFGAKIGPDEFLNQTFGPGRPLKASFTANASLLPEKYFLMVFLKNDSRATDLPYLYENSRAAIITIVSSENGASMLGLVQWPAFCKIDE